MKELKLFSKESKWFNYFVYLAVFYSIAVVLLFSYNASIGKGEDLPFHYMRFLGIKQAIIDGNYPNYIDYLSIKGYGYASNFFYPTYMLVPFAFLAIYTNNVFAYICMLIFYNLLCLFITYYSVYGITKNARIAILTAFLYTLCYYRMFNLFHRAALGEVISFAFSPLCFYGIYLILYSNYKKWYILSLGVTLLALTHLVYTFLVVLILGFYVLFHIKIILREKYRFYALVKSAVMCILLCSFFLIPMLDMSLSDEFYFEVRRWGEMENTVQPYYKTIAGLLAGLYPYRYFFSSIGVSLTFLVGFRVFIKKEKRKNNKLIQIADQYLIMAIVLFICTLSFFPWEYYPFKWLDIIQFPFRFVHIISFLLAFSASVYVMQLFEKKIKYKHLVIITGILLVFLQTFRVFEFYNPAFLQSHRNITNNTNIKEISDEVSIIIEGELEIIPSLGGGAEYLPDTLSNEVGKEGNIQSLVRGNPEVKSNNDEVLINDYLNEKGIVSFNFQNNKQNDTYLVLPKIFYKYYQVLVNGKEFPIEKASSSLVKVNIGDIEKGEVILRYKVSTIQKVAYLISFLTFIFFIFIIIKENYYKKRIVK